MDHRHAREVSMVSWVDVASYIAPVLVFMSFFMKEIVPLRLVAIASNVAFALYGIGAGLVPIVVLHAVLLPLNVWRVIEYKRLERKVRDASQGAAAVEKIVPLMSEARAGAGETLFRKDDRADALYYLVEGRIRFEEVDTEIGPGTVFGEIGMFLGDARRTATATCLEPCVLRALPRRRVEQLVMVDPGFGLFLTRLITQRMSDNLDAAQRA
jgi:hypothetical protein